MPSVEIIVRDGGDTYTVEMDSDDIDLRDQSGTLKVEKDVHTHEIMVMITQAANAVKCAYEGRHV